MIQSSCSELLVDTKLEEPEKALKYLTKLLEVMDWVSTPSLTLDILKALKARGGGDRLLEWQLDCELKEEAPEVLFSDKEGNRAWLLYGNNGYIDLGYYLDSSCNHYDSRCFPIFKGTLDHMPGSELMACDGGSTEVYESWDSNIIEGSCREILTPKLLK